MTVDSIIPERRRTRSILGPRRYWPRPARFATPRALVKHAGLCPRDNPDAPTFPRKRLVQEFTSRFRGNALTCGEE